jgi:hypothetical protein
MSKQAQEPDVRIRSKWNIKNRDRTPEEIAGVVGFISWRIASQAVLDLENNDFQTDTQQQRLDIIWEFSAFLIHVTDRLMYPRMEQDERRDFITALARNMAQTMQDNMEDIIGPGEYKPGLIDKLNQRMAEFSEFGFDAESGPSFPMLRYFGECITGVMGERNRKWITTHIIDIEAPDAVKTLKRGIANLLPEDETKQDAVGA